MSNIKTTRSMKAKMMMVAMAVLLSLSSVYVQAKGETSPIFLEQSKDRIYDVVEVMPKYKNGMSDLMAYLCENVRYPEEAIKKKIQGTVTIKLIIEKDGSVSNVKVHPLLDAEAMRVVKAMGKWTPGTMKGKPVRVSYHLPIRFLLK